MSLYLFKNTTKIVDILKELPAGTYSSEEIRQALVVKHADIILSLPAGTLYTGLKVSSDWATNGLPGRACRWVKTVVPAPTNEPMMQLPEITSEPMDLASRIANIEWMLKIVLLELGVNPKEVSA